jgi:ABC-type antimicrobial peptide transport system permease subunit
MRVAWYRFRASFKRRWTGYLSVVVLVGAIGGLALSSLAGARRTDSSFPTYLASTNPSTLEIFARYDDPGLGMNTGYNAKISNAIARQPLVTRSATAIIFDGNMNIRAVKGIHPNALAGEAPPTFVGSFDGETYVMDRVTLVQGRVANPKRANEAVMNEQAAQEMGVHVGSVIQIPFYTDAQTQSSQPLGKPFLLVNVKLVGEVVASTNVVESDVDRLNAAEVIFSPALTRELAAKCATGTEQALQIQGGSKNAKRVLAEVYKVDPVAAHLPAEITSAFVPTAQQAISPEAIALGVFGAIAALAVLLIVGLMVGRLLRAGADELDTLRALGASRSMLLGDELVGVLASVLLGTVLAVVVAVGLSPLSPLGPVRPIYPHPGVSFDGTVLGFGFLILCVGLGGLAIVLARREVRRITQRRPVEGAAREARWVRTTANSGLPISALTGVRFALERGRGRNAAPVRAAVLGAVLAVTVLVSTITWAASLNSLVSHPSLYGWNWNYAMLSGFSGAEDLPGPQMATFLNKDPDVKQWSGAYVAKAQLDGMNMTALVERPGAKVMPPILSGHGLEAANQVVLGVASLRQLDKRVGESVTFSNGSSKSKSLLIVGIMTAPSLNGGSGGGSGLGQGALVAISDFTTSQLNLQSSSIPGPNVIFVRVKTGVAPSVAYQSLRTVEHEVNAIPAARGATGGIVKVLRPAEIANFRSMGAIPDVLAAGLAVGAVAALGLTLIASVRRRRRDLALLKALGFTQRQLAASIAWQATVAALIGCVIGIPLGIVIGRELWNLFARGIDVVPDPAVPALTVVLVGVGALIFANLVAAIPGRIAARTSTALVLRAE